MIDGATIIFSCSLVGILGMLGLKYSEVRTGRRSFLAVWSDATNHRVHAAVAYTRTLFAKINKENAVIVLHTCVVWISQTTHRWYVNSKNRAHTHPQSKKVIDMVRGTSPIKKKGSAPSLFLKRIKEEAKEDEPLQ